jgi:hypothetical protein
MPMILALLLGAGLLFASVLSFAVAIALIVTLMARVIHTGYAGQSRHHDGRHAHHSRWAPD